tara:strand:+ start:14167 stop:15672 length:1506 start_codon:yes stop_codon:yes gene_type:complete
MLLLQAVFLPIILAPLIYFIGLRIGKNVGWLVFLILFYCTSLLLYSGFSSPEHLESYNWEPIGEFGLFLDGLSFPFAALIYILSTVIAMYSIPYMAHRIKEDLHSKKAISDTINRKISLYYALYLVYAAGMLGTVLATNLIQFYIFFELMLIPSFFLIAEFGYGERQKISLMYFLWTHVGAIFLLGGILTIGLFGGSFNFFDLNESGLPSSLRVWVGIAISVGLLTKLAAAGLHVWLPYAHAESPTPISALLSPAMIGIGAYAFLRIFLFILPSIYPTIVFAISLWGLLTMIYGGLMAYAQDDLKRLLAYSSVSQMGYIIFGMGSLYYLGVTGSVFHYVSHGTGKALLFMAAGSIIMQTGGVRSIKKLGGLGSKLPITGIAAMIGFLAIVGVPPTNGFQSEWMIFAGSFAGALETGSTGKLILTAIALAGTPITAGYALLTIRKVFFGELPSEFKNIKDPSFHITIPLLFLSALTLIIGIYPSVITDNLVPLLQNVFGGIG